MQGYPSRSAGTQRKAASQDQRAGREFAGQGKGHVLLSVCSTSRSHRCAITKFCKYNKHPQIYQRASLFCVQHGQQIQVLKSQLKAAEQRADSADVRANKSDAELASWRQVQADVARSLPTTWDSKSRVDGEVDPSIGHSIPRHHMLLHFSKGSTPSPASQMQKDLRSCQAAQNPVAVFRQVYRTADASHPGAVAASDRGDSKSGRVPAVPATAHLREGAQLNPDSFPMVGPQKTYQYVTLMCEPLVYPLVCSVGWGSSVCRAIPARTFESEYSTGSQGTAYLVHM